MQKILLFIVTATAFFLVSCQASYSPTVPPIYIPARSGEVNFETGPKAIGLGLRSNANIKKGWGLTSSVEGGAYFFFSTIKAFDVGLNYVLPNSQNKPHNMQFSLTYGRGVSALSNLAPSPTYSIYSYAHILGTFNYEFGNKKPNELSNSKIGVILQTGCVGEYRNEKMKYMSFTPAFESIQSVVPALNGYFYFRSESQKAVSFISYLGATYSTGAHSAVPKLGLGLSIRNGYGKKNRKLSKE